jgi:imidazolonepropionase
VTTAPAADLLLLHARDLLTCAGPCPRSGPLQAHAGAIEDGAIASFQGRIVHAGPSAGLDSAVRLVRGARVVDLGQQHSIVPGLVDAHTHAAFAGDRRGELARRLAGETYAGIAASGGGILSTVSATRQASVAQLIAATRARLDEMLACGTTTCEIKSGYGLDTDAELKMLRAIQALQRDHPLTIVATFMGAHEIPPEYRHARDEYVALVVNEMIPAVAEAGLAEWCDVFCEEGVFTPAESLRILQAGAGSGLKPRIHADELGSSGGAAVAAAVGARSADHLVFVSPAHIRQLASARVTATLLPIAAFYLKLGRYAPARALIDAGVPVAIATDVNPGGGLSPSMPFAMALSCFCMNMTFEEALVAATANAAWSLDRAETVGSLEPGKLADLVVVRGAAVNLVRIGAPSVSAVIKRGDTVHGVLPGAHGDPG